MRGAKPPLQNGRLHSLHCLRYLNVSIHLETGHNLYQPIIVKFIGTNWSVLQCCYRCWPGQDLVQLARKPVGTGPGSLSQSFRVYSQFCNISKYLTTASIFAPAFMIIHTSSSATKCPRYVRELTLTSIYYRYCLKVYIIKRYNLVYKGYRCLSCSTYHHMWGSGGVALLLVT
jgi:hypothetical protein